MTLSAKQKLALSLLPFALISACAGKPGPVGNNAVPEPAKAVELDRYLGKWFEMARYEAPFQKDCDGVTADYSLRDDGKIKVINSCTKDGKTSTANGKAKIVENSQNAKLKVSFFGPFYGDYWVLDRADDYSWAIVGEPSGRYLWMLTRQAQPEPGVRARIEARVKEMGYDWSLVRVTDQG
ncbi:MAG: lipocalin family protein [Parasphingorhabdus sp.]|uniref:lipocalin family protein n=1 Tax=Parasphingorhabdus sp. TaxID=2709688 RepID=UPI003296DD13